MVETSKKKILNLMEITKKRIEEIKQKNSK